MNNTKTLAMLAAAISLAACEGPSKSGAKESSKREKCSVKSVDGNVGFILPSRNDCGATHPVTGASHSCAAQGIPGNPTEWIFVPAGKCDAINKHVQSGKFSKIDTKTKEKLDLKLAKKHIK